MDEKGRGRRRKDADGLFFEYMWLISIANNGIYALKENKAREKWLSCPCVCGVSVLSSTQDKVSSIFIFFS